MNILQTDSVEQNHSADWCCRSESFCSYSPPQKSNPIYIWCSIYKSQHFGLLFFGENERRMILFNRIILQNIISRIILLCRLSHQNILSRIILQNILIRLILLRIFSRLILSSRIILQTDSVKHNYSALIRPPKIATRKADTYIFGALYISLSFLGCYFWGRMRAEWFCLTESFCRIFLAKSFCCADWVSRIFSADWFCEEYNLQTDSVKQNYSANWFCRAESFCFYSPPRISLQNILSKIILICRMSQQNIFSRMILQNILSRTILLRIFCRLILLSRIILQTDSVEQNHFALILPNRIILQRILCRIMLLTQSAQQNDSVEQNHSAEWFCRAEWFCSHSPQQNRPMLPGRISSLLIMLGWTEDEF